jgi:hypothetical protein
LNKKFALLFLIVFLLGWFSSSVYSNYFNNYKIAVNNMGKNNYEDSGLNQNKNTINKKSINALKEFEKIEKLLAEDVKENKDKDSPYDWIKPEQIFVYNEGVIIKIQNPEWSIFTNTKSMYPVIDSTSNAIEIIPKSENDIHIGDIVAYKSKYKEGIVTHRVVDIGYDAFGWYARLKGDNNNYMDPGKVRFEQIKRIVVGIIY